MPTTAEPRDIYMLPDDDLNIELAPNAGDDYVELGRGGHRVHLVGGRTLFLTTMRCPDPAAHRPHVSRLHRLAWSLRLRLASWRYREDFADADNR